MSGTLWTGNERRSRRERRRPEDGSWAGTPRSGHSPPLSGPARGRPENNRGALQAAPHSAPRMLYHSASEHYRVIPFGLKNSTMKEKKITSRRRHRVPCASQELPAHPEHPGWPRLRFFLVQRGEVIHPHSHGGGQGRAERRQETQATPAPADMLRPTQDLGAGRSHFKLPGGLPCLLPPPPRTGHVPPGRAAPCSCPRIVLT